MTEKTFHLIKCDDLDYRIEGYPETTRLFEYDTSRVRGFGVCADGLYDFFKFKGHPKTGWRGLPKHIYIHVHKFEPKNHSCHRMQAISVHGDGHFLLVWTDDGISKRRVFNVVRRIVSSLTRAWKTDSVYVWAEWTD